MSKSVASSGEASTKLPEDEGNDSDMDTNFSRRSKAKPFNKRPIAQQAKHLQRAMIFKGADPEMVLRMTVEEVMNHRDAKKLEESASSSLTEARMSAYHDQLANDVDPVKEMMNFNAVEYIAKNKDHRIKPEEVEKVHKMCIVDGMCRLCAKGCYDDPNDLHLKSQAHLEKVNEQALCNRLFGESCMFRRLSQGCRFKNKQDMRSYWGSQVDNLGHVARQLVYEESRVIYYKHGKSNSANYTITKDDKPRFHLAALKYDRETGKYARRQYLVKDVELWHNLDDLDSGDVDTPQAPQDQVLGNGEGNGSGTNDQDNYANGTWWPVLLCQLPSDVPGPYQTIVPGYVYVIICFYQVLDTPLWAWTIEFR